MFLTFHYQVWVALMSSSIVFSLCFKILAPKYSTSRIRNWILLTLTGKGYQIWIRDNKAMIIMFFWSLGALILSLGFTSSLISALTKPAVEKPMRTWQDLLDNDYTILTPRIYVNGNLIITLLYFESAIKVMYILNSSVN